MTEQERPPPFEAQGKQKAAAYTGADERWSSWSAVQLLAAGFEFPAGGAFVGRGSCGRRGRRGGAARGLPESGGDGGGVGCRTVRRSCIRALTGEEFVEPLGVNFGAKKIGFGENAAEEGDVGLDAGDGGFFQGATKAVQPS